MHTDICLSESFHRLSKWLTSSACHVAIVAIGMVAGCEDAGTKKFGFRCTAASTEQRLGGVAGVFHFEAGYLFVRNANGGADNVCARNGTTECSINVTDKRISFEQTVVLANCSWRRDTRTSLLIDRDSGQFRLVQENCDPNDDVITEGICQFW